MLHRRCRTTIEALTGGYHYPKERPNTADVMGKKPTKDGYYDNLADTMRYHCMLFYKPLLMKENQDILFPNDQVQPANWEWMQSGIPITR